MDFQREYTWRLGPGTQLVSCQHGDCVSLMTNGSDQPGFVIKLTPAHIPVLEKVIRELDDLNLERAAEAPW